MFCFLSSAHRDRIDIILGSATPPPNVPLLHSGRHHYPDEVAEGTSSAAAGVGHYRNRTSASAGSSRHASPSKTPADLSDEEPHRDHPEAVHELSDAMELYEDGHPDHAAAIATSRLHLPELREVWRGCTASAAYAENERRLLFNPYHKPTSNPLRIKPLMYNVEYNNYVHSAHQAQLPQQPPTGGGAATIDRRSTTCLAGASTGADNAEVSVAAVGGGAVRRNTSPPAMQQALPVTASVVPPLCTFVSPEIIM